MPCDKARNHGRVDRLGQVYCPRSWFIMECIRLVSIVALGHLIREYNRLREPLQFPDECGNVSRDHVKEKETRIQFNKSRDPTEFEFSKI